MQARIGPFGGPDGNPWDDEAEHTGVRGIKLTYKEAVGSFRAVYDSNGNPDLGPGHPSGDFSYRPGDVSLLFIYLFIYFLDKLCKSLIYLKNNNKEWLYLSLYVYI